MKPLPIPGVEYKKCTIYIFEKKRAGFLLNRAEPARELYSGIDDATNCPCIGSIFLAGVTATAETIEKWHHMGVKDSKLVTAKKRLQLEKEIKKTALSFTVTQIPPRLIDNKCINLNARQMMTVLDILSLLQHERVQKIYIDNWETSQEAFFLRLRDMALRKRKKIDLKAIEARIVAEHFADENYTIVGAASILAKNASDRQYVRYRRKYGDFGSGSPADPKTRLFVWKTRQNPPVIVRQSWQTFKTLSQLQRIEEDGICARYLEKTKRDKVIG